MSCTLKVSNAFGAKPEEVARMSKVIDDLKLLHANDVAAFRAAAMKAKTEAEKSALKHIKNNINTTATTLKNLEHIYQPGFFSKDKNKNRIPNPAEGILSLFEPTTRKVFGKFSPISYRTENNHRKLMAPFLQKLQEENLLGFARTRDNELEIIKRVWNYDPKFAKSNDPIDRIAHWIKALNEKSLRIQQEAGSTIEPHPNYVFGQTHDADKILLDSANWAQTILPLLDVEKTFGSTTIPVEKQMEILLGMSRDLESIQGLSNKTSTLSGGSRGLIFKGPEAFHAYNKEYGYSNLLSGLNRSTNSAARKAAFISVLGPDPKASLEQLKKLVADITGPLTQKENNVIDSSFLLSAGNGSSSVVTKPGWAKASTTVKVYKSAAMMAMLGKTAIRTIGDIADITMTHKVYGGRALPVAMAKSVIDMIKVLGVRSKDLESTLSIAIKGHSNLLADYDGMASDRNPLERGASYLANKFMMISGNDILTRHWRKVAAVGHMANFKKIVNTDPSTWNNFQKNTMEASGFSMADLNNLKTIAALDPEGDYTPANISIYGSQANIVPDKFPNTPKGKEAYLAELQNKLSGFYSHMVMTGSPRPTIKESRWSKKDLAQDDPERVVADIWSFLWSYSMRKTNIMAEAMRASSANGELFSYNGIKTAAQWSMASASVYYSTTKLLEFINKGEVDFNNEEKNRQDFINAIANSGVGGVAFDAMYQFAEPFNRRSGARVPMPIVQTASEAFKAIPEFLEKGEVSESRYRRLLKSVAPGQNLWYFDNEFRRSLLEIGLYDDNLQ